MILTEFNVESAIKTWREDGYEDGMTAGVQKGRQEKAVEDAQKLLELNTMTVEQIAYVTELPIEKIRELQKNIVCKPRV